VPQTVHPVGERLGGNSRAWASGAPARVAVNSETRRARSPLPRLRPGRRDAGIRRRRSRATAPHARRRAASPARAGGPAKIAAAVTTSADQEEAPKRLTLGSGAYELATVALRDRLEALKSARDLAYSTDTDDYVAERAGSTE
jgi:hypothetical protein